MKKKLLIMLLILSFLVALVAPFGLQVDAVPSELAQMQLALDAVYDALEVLRQDLDDLEATRPYPDASQAVWGDFAEASDALRLAILAQEAAAQAILDDALIYTDAVARIAEAEARADEANLAIDATQAALAPIYTALEAARLAAEDAIVLAEAAIEDALAAAVNAEVAIAAAINAEYDFYYLFRAVEADGLIDHDLLQALVDARYGMVAARDVAAEAFDDVGAMYTFVTSAAAFEVVLTTVDVQELTDAGAQMVATEYTAVQAIIDAMQAQTAATIWVEIANDFIADYDNIRATVQNLIETADQAVYAATEARLAAETAITALSGITNTANAIFARSYALALDAFHIQVHGLARADDRFRLLLEAFEQEMAAYTTAVFLFEEYLQDMYNVALAMLDVNHGVDVQNDPRILTARAIVADDAYLHRTTLLPLAQQVVTIADHWLDMALWDAQAHPMQQAYAAGQALYAAFLDATMLDGVPRLYPLALPADIIDLAMKVVSNGDAAYDVIHPIAQRVLDLYQWRKDNPRLDALTGQYVRHINATGNTALQEITAVRIAFPTNRVGQVWSGQTMTQATEVQMLGIELLVARYILDNFVYGTTNAQRFPANGLLSSTNAAPWLPNAGNASANSTNNTVFLGSSASGYPHVETWGMAIGLGIRPQITANAGVAFPGFNGYNRSNVVIDTQWLGTEGSVANNQGRAIAPGELWIVMDQFKNYERFMLPAAPQAPPPPTPPTLPILQINTPEPPITPTEPQWPYSDPPLPTRRIFALSLDAATLEWTPPTRPTFDGEITPPQFTNLPPYITLRPEEYPPPATTPPITAAPTTTPPTTTAPITTMPTTPEPTTTPPTTMPTTSQATTPTTPTSVAPPPTTAPTAAHTTTFPPAATSTPPLNDPAPHTQPATPTDAPHIPLPHPTTPPTTTPDAQAPDLDTPLINDTPAAEPPLPVGRLPQTGDPRNNAWLFKGFIAAALLAITAALQLLLAKAKNND